MYDNEESTNELTPKACNNFYSNNLDANRLLSEHVKIQKNTNMTRSYKLLVSEDDTSAGSDVIQPKKFEQDTRDVVIDVDGSLACLVFHFQSSNYIEYVLLLRWTLEE